MSVRVPDIADLDWKVSDHVCAFYKEDVNLPDDIIVDYLLRGCRRGTNAPSSTSSRWPGIGVKLTVERKNSARVASWSGSLETRTATNSPEPVTGLDDAKHCGAAVGMTGYPRRTRSRRIVRAKMGRPSLTSWAR